jgi:hypothetical protein
MDTELFVTSEPPGSIAVLGQSSGDRERQPANGAAPARRRLHGWRRCTPSSLHRPPIRAGLVTEAAAAVGVRGVGGGGGTPAYCEHPCHPGPSEGTSARTPLRVTRPRPTRPLSKFFPVEFRRWIKDYIENSGIKINASQISGLGGTGGGSTTPTNLPAGIIIPYAGGEIGTDCLPCNGAAVSRTDYAALFKSIAETWGAGAGGSLMLGSLVRWLYWSLALAAALGLVIADAKYPRRGRACPPHRVVCCASTGGTYVSRAAPG